MSDREYDKHRKWVPDDIELHHVQAYVNKHFFVLPLYLYDHSGIAMSATPFGCPWDSGQVGFIYAERDQAEYPDPMADLLNEVKTYDRYLSGDVYGYVIKDMDCNELSSSWGFYGFNQCKEDALAEAKCIADQLQTSFVI